MSLSLPKLFKLGSRGKSLEWEIGFDGVEGWTLAGQVDGKKVLRKFEIKLNSSGRNLEEQALLEIKSRHKKKIDEGYSETLEINSLDTPETGLMLASQFRDDLVNYPCVAQPKIDGIRMCAFLQNGELITTSRRNNNFNFLEELKAEIIDYLGTSTIKLDGELYSFTLNFDQISGVVRSKKTRNTLENEIVYIIFDNLDSRKQTQRRLEKLGVPLQNWEESESKELFEAVSEHIYILRSWIINSREELDDFEDYVLDQKLEGVMIRHLDGPKAYYRGYRCQNLLKLKKEHDDEGVIVGFTTGSGAERDKVIWKVEDKNGNIIHMRPCGTFEAREEQLKNAEDYIGRVVTYRYFELNPITGIPRFPRVLRFRDDEPQ